MEIVKASDTVSKQIKLLSFGESGVGKTRFATNAEDTVIIDFERGLASVQNPNVDVLECKTAGDFKRALEFLKEDTKYKTVVVDSFTEYSEKLFLALKQAFPAMEDGMKLWMQFDMTLRERHDALIALDKNIIVNALVEDVITDMVAKAYPMFKAKKFKQIIGAKYDLVGYMSMEDGKRTIAFKGTDRHIGKNRFADKGVPDVINEESELFSAGAIFNKIKTN